MDDSGRRLHPLHLIALTSAFPLLLGATIADMGYRRTFEVQWSNFAAWLLVGAQVFLSIALLFALFDVARKRLARGAGSLYLLVLAATWLLGLIDNLVHAMDAWEKMPSALILSLVTTILACIALWLAHGGVPRRRVERVESDQVSDRVPVHAEVQR